MGRFGSKVKKYYTLRGCNNIFEVLKEKKKATIPNCRNYWTMCMYIKTSCYTTLKERTHLFQCQILLRKAKADLSTNLEETFYI